MKKMQWTGSNLKELSQWSENHVRVRPELEPNQLILITPDGDQLVTTGDWVVRLKNRTYEVKPDELKEAIPSQSLIHKLSQWVKKRRETKKSRI